MIFHANDDTPGAIAAYPLNVQDARTSVVDNPKYAPLKIRRILNNEVRDVPAPRRMVAHMPPGAYDLAVFAYSTVTNRFLPARVVRVVLK